MNDLDLYDTLARKPLAEAEAFRAKLKTAGLVDEAKQYVKAFVRNNKPELIGGAIGAGAGGIYGYVAGRRKKSGTSYLEEDSDKALRAHEAESKELELKNVKPGFRHKLTGAAARTGKELAAIAKDHPVAFGALIGSVGANVGSQIGSMTRRWRGK